MKSTKKAISITLTMLMLVSALTCLIISANAANDDYPTGKHVTLTIHNYAIPNTDNNIKTYNSQTGYANVADSEVTLPEGATPVNGAVFRIYRVGDINTQISKVQDSATLGLKNGVTRYTEIEKTTTDGGVATFDIAGNKHGLYYIEELSTPAKYISSPSKPSFVYLPSKNQTGNKWVTNVNVYSQNLYTRGSAVFTKRYETSDGSIKTIEEGNITFEKDQNTEIAFFLNKEDGKTIPIAEIMLSGNDATGVRTIKKNTTAFPPDIYNTLDSIEINEYKGVVLVNNLPKFDTDYYFKEIKGGTSSDGTEYETKNTEIDVTVTGNSNVQFNGNKKVDYDKLDKNVVNVGLDNPKSPAFRNHILDSLQNTPPELILPVYGQSESKKSASIVNSKDTFLLVLESDVPENIKSVETCEIEDKIENYLSFYSLNHAENGISVYYTVKNSDGKETTSPLNNPGDYTLTIDSNANTIRCVITAGGILKLDEAKNRDETILYISIPVKLNIDCKLDGKKNQCLSNRALENKATLRYTFLNKTGAQVDIPKEPTEATTYFASLGAKIKNVDWINNTQGLQGTQFELKEKDDNTGAPLNVKDLGSNQYALTSEKTGVTIESGATGDITIYGLEKKNYTLTETKAPVLNNREYQLLTDPITLNINETSINTPTESNKRLIKNLQKPYLPATGGIGIIIFVVTGIAVAGGSTAILLAYKRRQKLKP